MKAIPNKHRSILLYRQFPPNSTGSMLLTGADNSEVELTTGVRIRQTIAEYFIPAQYITEETLPLHVELKVNGTTVRIVDLSSSVSEVSEPYFEVVFNDGWPERPTDDASVIVSWFGGTPADEPTGALAGMDLWYVPASGVITDG